MDGLGILRGCGGPRDNLDSVSRAFWWGLGGFMARYPWWRISKLWEDRFHNVLIWICVSD